MQRHVRRLNWEAKEVVVDALAEKLDARLHAWKPETAARARDRIAEIIELADHDVLDLARSRAVEQQVLDLLLSPHKGGGQASMNPQPGQVCWQIPGSPQKRGLS